MVVKSYKTVAFKNLHIPFVVGQRRMYADFNTQVCGERGMFTTSDEALQRIMEDSPRYGRDFVLCNGFQLWPKGPTAAEIEAKAKADAEAAAAAAEAEAKAKADAEAAAAAAAAEAKLKAEAVAKAAAAIAEAPKKGRKKMVDATIELGAAEAEAGEDAAAEENS